VKRCFDDAVFSISVMAQRPPRKFRKLRHGVGAVERAACAAPDECTPTEPCPTASTACASWARAGTPIADADVVVTSARPDGRTGAADASNATSFDLVASLTHRLAASAAAIYTIAISAAAAARFA